VSDATQFQMLVRPGNPDFLDLRAQLKSFDGLAAFASRSVDVGDGKGLPERYRCPLLSANGFALIGQRPVLGRDFRAEDEKPGAPAVVLLSHGLWERRYGKDPGVRPGALVVVKDFLAEP